MSTYDLVHVLPSKDGVFVIQPVSRRYLNWHRAASTAIIFKMSRINCGFGAFDSELVTASDGLEILEMAMSKRKTPGHIIQVVFAQWLAFYIGLKQKYKSISISFNEIQNAPDSFVIVNSPIDLLSDKDGIVDKVGSGNVIISPAALLAYLVDWYGSILWPLQNMQQPGNASTYTSMSTMLDTLLLTKLKDGSRTKDIVMRGIVDVDKSSFVAHLNSIFNPYVFIDGVSGKSSRVNLNVNEHLLAVQQFAHTLDVQLLDYEADATVTVCSDIKVSPEKMTALLDPSHAILVFCAHGKHELYTDALFQVNRDANDAPLEYLCVNASINAFVNSFPDASSVGKAAQNELFLQIWRLYPGADKNRIKKHIASALAKRNGASCEDSTDKDNARHETTEVETKAKLPLPFPPSSSHLKDVGSTTKTSGPPAAPFPPGSPSLTRPPEQLTTEHTTNIPKDDTFPTTPRDIQPGRLHTIGPNIITIYLKCLPFKKDITQACIATLCAFFNNWAIYEDKSLVYATLRGEIVYNLRKQPNSTYKQRLEIDTTLKLSKSAKPKTGPVLKSVIFTKEDMLWIAVTETDRVRDIVTELWGKHHLRNLTSKRFDDKITADIVHKACHQDLSQANKWEKGAIAEMIFRFDDNVGNALLQELESTMVETTVCEKDKKIYYGLRLKDFSCNGTHELIPNGSSLNLVKLSTTLKIQPIPEYWSEWFIKGVTFTATQLALLFANGGDAEFYAIGTLLSMSVTRNFSVEKLRRIAHKDKAEIAKRLIDVGAVDESATHLTVSSTPFEKSSCVTLSM